MESQTTPLLLAVLIVALTTTVTIFLVRYSLKKQRERLERLAAVLPQARVEGSLVMRIESQLEGRMFHITPVSGGKNQPPRLRVQLLAPFTFKLNLYTEGAGTRFFKSLGLLRDLKVGDPIFDERFLIRTSDEQQAGALLADARMREVVGTIFDLGYLQITLDSKGIAAVRILRDWDADLSPQSVRTVMDGLSRLARGLGA